VDIRKQCLDAGCHSFVTKPFRPETIVRACDDAIGKAA
jgi:CheY-like chemotaxis protein